MNKGKRSICIMSCLLFSSMTQAATHPIMTLTAGSDHANVGKTSTNIVFIPPFYNSYLGSNKNDTEFVGGLFLGAESDFYSDWKWQYGLSYYQTSALQVNGIVNQFGSSAFANLNYNYQIQNRRYLIETKILSVFNKIYHPYFNLGLGEAVNKSYGYNEQPVTSADVPMSQPFANKTSHNFTYFVGVGIDVDMNSHFRVGAGYRYANLGKAGLNSSPLQQDTTTITNNIIHAGEFFMQLSLIN